MADALVFPRLVYRGDPDTLGTGLDVKGNHLNSETKKVDSQVELDAHLKDGWRLTRDDHKHAKSPDVDPRTSNVTTLTEYIATVTTAAELDRLLAEERTQQDPKGGRPAVLKAIEARRVKLLHA